ncbi:MAG TPA: M36 family metallopeptidase, partial [Polyangia bacterium]
AALAATSAAPARVAWDPAFGVAREVAGDFPAAAGPPAEAALAFLARHAPLFGLDDARDLVVASVHESLVGSHVRLRQHAGGLEVHGVEVAVHRGHDARVFLVRSGYVPGLAAPAPRLGRLAAADTAVAAALAAGAPAGAVEDATPVVLDDGRGAWRVLVRRDAPARLQQVIVADDGRVVAQRDLLRRADGQGWVYDPNPMAMTGDLTLADNNNADSDALTAARVQVTLPELDDSGHLQGPHVTVFVGANGQSTEPSGVFNYTRSQDGFEETMAYFHLDRAARRLRTLGFATLMAAPIETHVNDSRQDNSWYDPQKKTLTFGRGGVDDAEDADVLLHEYGHAIQDDQVPGFGSTAQAGAMGEGFGDFFAGVGHAVAGTNVLDPACVMPWDTSPVATTSPPCLRRLDGTKHYPEHADNEVHDDGEIYSAALWEAALAVGHLDMLTEVVQSQYLLAPDATFKQSAQAILTTDQQIAAGANTETLRRIFTWRGLLDDLAPPAPDAGAWASYATAVESAHPYGDLRDEVVDISHPGAAAVRVHFASFDTEANYDHVYLYDPAVRLYAVYTGARGSFTSVAVPGDTVRVRLVSDPNTHGAGYVIDAYEVPTTAQDAGAPDAMPVADDAGDGPAAPGDAAPGDAAPADLGGRGGCACRAGAAGTAAPAWLLVALAALGAAWRRRARGR